MSVLAFPTVVSDPIFQPSSKVLIFDGSFDGCFDVVKCSLCHNLRGMAAPRNGRMAVLPPRGMAVRLPRGMAVCRITTLPYSQAWIVYHLIVTRFARYRPKHASFVY